MQKLIWKNALGDEIDLTSGNYGITEWEGFSNASLNIQSQQVPFQDGGVFLDALIEQRELSVTLAMQDNNNLEERYRMRRELVHALNPKLGEGYLIYTNNFISKRIKCVAQIPLFETHNSDTVGTPKASLAWTACEPYWEDLEETVVEINNNDLVNIENDGDVSVQLKANISVENDLVILQNLTSNKAIEIIDNISGNIDINTNVGEKEVVKTQYDYNIIQGGDFYDGVVLESEVILCGSTIYKYNIFSEEITIEKNNLPYRIISIAYSPTLNMFAVVCDEGDGINFHLYTSTDLVNWTEITGITLSKLSNLVSWEDSMFKVRISNSSSLASTDGVIWEIGGGEITKNLTHIFYKGKYYRRYNDKLQSSTDDVNWQNEYTFSGIFHWFFLQVYDKLFVFGFFNTILLKGNNADWQLLEGDVNYYDFKKFCGFEDSVYFIASSKYVVKYHNEISEIILNKNGVPKDIIVYNNKLFIAYVSGERTYIYSSSDGINFDKKIIPIAQLDYGGFFINKTTDRLYINITYGVFDYDTINDNWISNNDFYNWISNTRNGDFFVITEFNNAFYIGSMTDRNNSGDIIYKTTDFINYTVVYRNTNLSQNIFYGCYSDKDRLVFVGYAGLVVYSTNGNSFTKKNPIDAYSLEKVIRYDGEYHILGTQWNKYLVTKNFVNFETKDSPQQGVQELRYIDKYLNRVFCCGSFYQVGFFGGEVMEVKTNIIDKISSTSDMNLNIILGNNAFTVQGSEFTKAYIKYRQKYIGV